MTVAELMEELRRMPPERPMLIEFLGEETACGAPDLNLGSVDDLREAQAFSHHQPIVIISAAAWVR
jgi:hypothetical protein